MRWLDFAKRVAIGDLILLETQFPFVADAETHKEKWSRHHTILMRDFGSEVEGKAVTGALALWQIGNCFKHGTGTDLHPPTKEVVKKLGFASQILDMPEHEADEKLKQLALQEVNYTLGSDSIERMALQLGCGPERGLMPLYEHVESWRKAVDEKLAAGVRALRDQA